METITPLPIRPAWLPESVWPYPLAELNFGDRRVVYTDTGGDGPVVMLVHVGLWSLMWRDVIARLQPDHRCITLDVPGSGLSDRTLKTEQNLDNAVEAIGAVIDTLDLRTVTLVIHDLGGLASMAAVETRLDRIAGVAAVNTFAWRPKGFLLPLALFLFGSRIMREFSVFTGWLAWGSATRFGVGRKWDKATKRAWRAGLHDRSARRLLHRLFHDARTNRSVQHAAEASLAGLADRRFITVFGRFNDYFRFQKQWRQRHTMSEQKVVPWGFHFPMCDDPDLVAAALQRLAASVKNCRS